MVIAFEPDSLGTIDCLARSRRDDRLRLLRYGVSALAKLPNATIYLEAGASDWENAKRTAKQLRAIGIAKVRGFMLNATHYDWTKANIRHGLAISRRVGGKHFIINTAENGRGPVHYKSNRPRDQRLVQPGPAGARTGARPRTPPIRRRTRTCGSTGPGTRSRARDARSPGTRRERSPTRATRRAGSHRRRAPVSGIRSAIR